MENHNSSQQIAVSVICLAYNHAAYLEQCLESIVTQKTDFPFEVLVHDDCSTDGTTDIVRRYAEKYPHIIRPFYETENQYSRHIPITKTILVPQARGKYLAWCEGDDFWCNEHKLQKQFHFLENHPEYSMCVHRAKFRYVQFQYDQLRPSEPEDGDWSVTDIIRYGGGVFATNSLMMAKEVYISKPDAVFNVRGFGDFQLFVHGALEGKCRCFSDVMSVYNHGTPNSFTEKNRKDISTKVRMTEEFIKLLDRINLYTERKYEAEITQRKNAMQCELYILTKQKQYAKVEPYKSLWVKYTLKYYLRLFKDRHPRLVKIIYSMRR